MAKTALNGTRHWTAKSWRKIRAARARQPAPFKKHGAYAIQKALEGGRIDARTRLGKAAKELRMCLIDDLGGEASITTGQRLLVDRVVKSALFLESIESWVIQRGQIVDESGNSPPALSAFYGATANRLRLDLLALGLERRQQVPKSIHELLHGNGKAE